MSTRAERAVADAARAAREVVSDTHRLSSFRILRFGRHPDGYFHASVSVNGDKAYVHCRYGSWLHPKDDNPRATSMREVISPYRDALAERARAFVREEIRRNPPPPTTKKTKEASNAGDG